MGVLRSHHKVVRDPGNQSPLGEARVQHLVRNLRPTISCVPSKHLHDVPNQAGRANGVTPNPRNRHRTLGNIRHQRLPRRSRKGGRLRRPVKLDVRVGWRVQPERGTPRGLAGFAARNTRVQPTVVVLVQVRDRQRSRIGNVNPKRRQHRNPITIPRDHRSRIPARLARQNRHRLDRQRLIDRTLQDQRRRPIVLKVHTEHHPGADAANVVHRTANDDPPVVNAIDVGHRKYAGSVGVFGDFDVAGASSRKQERSVTLE